MIAPLGFDWRVGIGLISSLLQREVFVSTMGTIYGMENADAGAGIMQIGERMKADVDPISGAPVFTTLTAVSLLVYYVFAMQCFSTIAVVRRESNGWKWPAFQFVYMTALAYIMTFLVYQLGRLFFL